MSGYRSNFQGKLSNTLRHYAERIGTIDGGNRDILIQTWAYVFWSRLWNFADLLKNGLTLSKDISTLYERKLLKLSGQTLDYPKTLSRKNWDHWRWESWHIDTNLSIYILVKTLKFCRFTQKWTHFKQRYLNLVWADIAQTFRASFQIP